MFKKISDPNFINTDKSVLGDSYTQTQTTL